MPEGIPTAVTKQTYTTHPAVASQWRGVAENYGLPGLLFAGGLVRLRFRPSFGLFGRHDLDLSTLVELGL